MLITQKLFSEWCQPKRGTKNPEIMTNDVWNWLVKTKTWPHKAHKALGVGNKKSPGWCFGRYGQSKNVLPNGSTVFIGGAHEDYYDDDFYIYNDVIVKSVDGIIAIFGYPEDIFPATDSHSATLVGDEIFIVGRIGDPKHRKTNMTPVFILNIKDFSIRELATSGAQPNQLFSHKAYLSNDGDVLICEEGESTYSTTKEVVENIAVWHLCVQSGTWTKASEKQWTRWVLTREDGSRNELWNIGQLEYADTSGRVNRFTKEFKERLLKRGHNPDLGVYRTRYTPPTRHEALPENKHDCNVFRVLIDDVVIRYNQDDYSILVTIEGILPKSIIGSLKAFGLKTFTTLEGVPYKIIEL